jgi:hypothetical protein
VGAVGVWFGGMAALEPASAVMDDDDPLDFQPPPSVWGELKVGAGNPSLSCSVCCASVHAALLPHPKGEREPRLRRAVAWRPQPQVKMETVEIPEAMRILGKANIERNDALHEELRLL